MDLEAVIGGQERRRAGSFRRDGLYGDAPHVDQLQGRVFKPTGTKVVVLWTSFWYYKPIESSR